mgnify:FL=1|jgi:hypothetical protein
MGLSSKLILASKKAGTLINWQGNASLALTHAGIDAYVYSYTRAYQDEGEGSLSPLLQTVKNDTQIYNLTLAVDPNSIMLFEAALYFYNLPEPAPPASKRFTGLSRLIVHSTTGGSPFVIDNMDSLFDPNSNSYNIFSDDLANWGYTNLTAAATLDFTFELEWYE